MPEPSLDLVEDDAFQRRDWKIQRAGWAVFALLILAAISGLFGRGPLSAAVRSNSAVEVRYERFGRWRLIQSLEVRVLGSREPNEFVVWMSRPFREAFEIRSITPEPKQHRLGDDRIEFEFASTAESPIITFHLVPIERGLLDGAVGIDDQPDVAIRQFIYP
jgi:hypothetical protein